MVSTPPRSKTSNGCRVGVDRPDRDLEAMALKLEEGLFNCARGFISFLKLLLLR